MRGGGRVALAIATLLFMVMPIGRAGAQQPRASNGQPPSDVGLFKLAEDTSANVHVGLGALTKISNCCTALLQTNPPIGAVWNWNSGDPSIYPTIYKGFAFPGDRQPPLGYVAGTKPLTWFEKNHPSWIEFTCSAAHLREAQAIKAGDVAYEFHQSSYIPLNMVDPAVLSWLEQTFYGPAAASGNFQHLDFDNFQTNNGGSWSGQRCGHYDTRGRWVQQYKGSEYDPNYRADRVTFARDLQTWLHANYPGVAFAANLSWHQYYTGMESDFLKYVDFWFDEQGFTNGNVGDPWAFLDNVWQEKAEALNKFMGEGDRAWEDINKEPHPADKITHAEIQWALANYLLFKNDHSWIYICPVSNCYDQS